MKAINLINETRFVTGHRITQRVHNIYKKKSVLDLLWKMLLFSAWD